MQRIGYRRELRDRLREVSHILDEGLDVPDLHNLFHCEIAAEDAHGDVAEVADRVHRRHHNTGVELRFDSHVTQVCVVFVKFYQRRFLAVESLHDIMPAVHFLDVAVEFAEVLLLRGEIPLGPLYDAQHNDHRQRQNDEGEQRHQHIDGQHHREHAEYHRCGRDDLREALAERLVDQIDVVCDMTQHLAVRFRVVVLQRQAVHLFGNRAAQIEGYVVRYLRHDETLQERA